MERETLVDEGSWDPVDDGLTTSDPLGFSGYVQKAEGAAESVTAGRATIGRYPVELASFDFSSFGGSMGEVAGERLARAMDRAADRGVPFVLHTRTGGARMQEGMRALIQMPKVVAARIALGHAEQPFIGVYGDPTTGGVLASLAALADVSVAEAGATIGFAGPRVVETVTGHPLSEGSHTAEAALTNGLIDEVVEPDELREHITTILMVLAPDRPRPTEHPPEVVDAPPTEDRWAVVQEARSADRPLAHELLLGLADTFIALRGDRAGRDDPALDVAFARISGRRALVMSLDRERLPGPGAYRKARRTLSIAERLGIPILTLIDTRGADPSEESEAGGIAWEIARLFERMLCLSVPTISIVTGEGGSGGALAFATTDALLAYEKSIFSVIGPELAAQILWKDPSKASQAADLLRLSAHDLSQLGIADALIPEPVDANSVRQAFTYHLDRIGSADAATLVERRRQRWRNL